jgi:hypothetical protein
MSNEVESPENGSVSPETQAILDQLKAEGHTIEGQEATEPTEAPVSPLNAPEAEETTKEVDVPLQEKQSDTEANKAPVDRAPREPSLIPAWEHKVAEKRWDKEKSELLSTIEQLKAHPTNANQQAVAQQAGNLRELAQQYGLELDESQEKFFSALLSKAVPQDVSQKLEALERDRQITFLEAQYEDEFNKDVAPLLQERYGLDSTQLAGLKSKLHDVAFTDTYAKVPLRKVFLAEESEFKLQPNQQHETVKPTKSGKTRSASIDFDEVDEETFARMSPEEVERYSKHQIDKSGGRKWR